MATSASRPELLAQLKGQHLLVPDLTAAFQHWPTDVSSHLDQVRALVPSRIQRMTECSRKRRILEKVDGGLFSATWWPYAKIERADILSCVALWLFIWDDGNIISPEYLHKAIAYSRELEIDAEIGSSLSQDFEAAQAFRKQTISWVKQCLCISTNMETIPKPSNQIIVFFQTLAEAVNEVYDLEHRKLLFCEIQRFIEASEVEQAMRLSPDLPTVEEYVTNRMQTSAVYIICFFVEYGSDIMLPIEILTDLDMRTIWDSTNAIVWAHNDLFSLKKEMASNTVDSLVPLLFHEQGSLDQAVSAVIAITELAAARFDASEESLLTRYSGDDALLSDLKTYIDGCRRICTGNLIWSLQTKRYGICDDMVNGCLRTRL